MPKTIKVHYWKTRHQTQPWKYAVAMPDGILIERRERYVRPFTVKRGAMRFLDCKTVPRGYRGRDWGFTGGYAWMALYNGKPYRVEFIDKKPD